MYTLAIDIGGTKIAYALIEHKVNNPNFIFSYKIDTPKGIPNLANCFSEIFQKTLAKAKKLSYEVSSIIAIGSPGHFIGSEKNIIAPGSAHNLEAFPGEFDNLNLALLLKKILPKNFDIVINNDAIAQLVGGTDFILANEYILILGSKIGYIGVGTGLGGGFAKVSKTGEISIRTDGHISDIKIKDNTGQAKRAEDLLSGKAFFELTSKTLKEINSSSALLNKYRLVLKEMGLTLAKIAIKIYQGEISKIKPENNWLKKDIAFVKGIKIFFIGGSATTKGRSSKIIIATAEQYLLDKGFSDIKLIRIKNIRKAALWGAAKLAL
jgi:predicted NBD/HSP70 family sugar kinase